MNTKLINRKTGKAIKQRKITKNQLKHLYGKHAFNTRGKKILTKFEFINRENNIISGIGNIGYIAFLK